ncbi:hypothetical protein [Draconibacterium sp.]|uniref:hypothetical protein n=1 Tax=Draconibacterium sp. TaxID=1965318 RepID=UPI0035637864
MKTKLMNQKIIAAGVLVIAIVVTSFLVYANKNLNKKLAEEKLKSEMLLSEKLSKDKQISKYQDDIHLLNTDAKKLNKRIADTNAQIQTKNSEIAKFRAESKSAKELQKKMDELEAQHQKLVNELATLNNTLTFTTAENSKLSKQLDQVNANYTALFSDNLILKAMISDNYRTEALRGKNEKLTVNANRTNKLMVSFDLPANSSDNIYFMVTTPKGEELSSKDDLAAAINITNIGDGLLASNSETIMGSGGTKRVEMSYKPKQKLAKGIYQFTIYNNERQLGTTQLRLK